MVSEDGSSRQQLIPSSFFFSVRLTAGLRTPGNESLNLIKSACGEVPIPSRRRWRRMCVQDCRTFLWGGTGNPSRDPDGTCFCICDDDGWSAVDILGRASCVPVKTHQVFGWVGLALAAAALSHAAYHLTRQVSHHVLYLKSQHRVGRRRSAAIDSRRHTQSVGQLNECIHIRWTGLGRGDRKQRRVECNLNEARDTGTATQLPKYPEPPSTRESCVAFLGSF